MKTISVEQLRGKLQAGETLNIVDVRTDEEVALGMIRGAIHIPVDQIPARMDELNQAEHYYLTCRTNNRSGNAYMFLKDKGYDVTLIDGGMTAWQALDNE